MAFWGVFQCYDFVSLVTQEVFSRPTLYVRNVRIINGEQALNTPMPGFWGAIHCCDQIPGGGGGGFRVCRRSEMRPSGLWIEGWLSREVLSLASGKSSRMNKS